MVKESNAGLTNCSPYMDVGHTHSSHTTLGVEEVLKAEQVCIQSVHRYHWGIYRSALGVSNVLPFDHVRPTPQFAYVYRHRPLWKSKQARC